MQEKIDFQLKMMLRRQEVKQNQGMFVLPAVWKTKMNKMKHKDNLCCHCSKCHCDCLLVIDHEGPLYFFINTIYSISNLASFYLYLHCAGFRISTLEIWTDSKIKHWEIKWRDDISHVPFIWLMTSLEIIHLIKIMVNFVTTYINPADGHTKIWSNRRIIHHYLTTSFIIDFIAILPLQCIWMTHERNALWYLLKLIKTLPTVTQMDHRVFVSLLRSCNRKIWSIRHCDCLEEDHNKIAAIHLFSYLLQFIIMILNIFNFTYFISHLWMVFCYSVTDWFYGMPPRFEINQDS